MLQIPVPDVGITVGSAPLPPTTQDKPPTTQNEPAATIDVGGPSGSGPKGNGIGKKSNNVKIKMTAPNENSINASFMVDDDIIDDLNDMYGFGAAATAALHENENPVQEAEGPSNNGKCIIWLVTAPNDKYLISIF